MKCPNCNSVSIRTIYHHIQGWQGPKMADCFSCEDCGVRFDKVDPKISFEKKLIINIFKNNNNTPLTSINLFMIINRKPVVHYTDANDIETCCQNLVKDSILEVDKDYHEGFQIAITTGYRPPGNLRYKIQRSYLRINNIEMINQSS